jgi:thiamine biosynthesis protein ThiS
MRIRVNGEEREVREASSVAELLETLDLGGRVAVEVNLEIVPRASYAMVRLSEGDIVEVVAFFGGG